MSGSGSTLFTLFDEKEPAEVAARRVASEFGIASSAIEVAPQIEDDR